jgi:hypothetical protein
MVCNDGELPMSWIEVTVKGETAYLRANCVSGILPDTSRKTGAVIYCDPPIECLAVDESVVDVYAMLYEELEEEDEDDDITDEQYSDIIESYMAMKNAGLVLPASSSNDN